MKQLATSITLLALAIAYAAYANTRPHLNETAEAGEPAVSLTGEEFPEVVKEVNQKTEQRELAQIDGTPDRPEEFAPKEAGDPDSMPYNPKDPTFNLWKRFRDVNKDRKPGLINVQRTEGHFNWIGIPTFFHRPVALSPADLQAGQAEVAIMGADLVNGPRAITYGPQEMRNPRLSDFYLTWGKWSMPNQQTMVNAFEELEVVDYGDAPLDPMSMHRSIPVIRKMVADIAGVELEDGRHTIPMIIGGCHALMYPDVAGLVDVYGKGNVGVIHFDAHHDAVQSYFGHMINHGMPVFRLINEGLVPGKNFIQVGLRGYAPDAEGFEWMRKQGIRYHSMTEVERRGWDAVLTDVIREAKDGPKYLFISFDIDVVDPAFMPGTSTPEPGGMTTHEALNIVRRLCAESNVVGFELVELRPERDPGYVTMLNCNRILREALTGIAMRKKGLTSEHYLSPLTVDDGVKAPEEK